MTTYAIADLHGRFDLLCLAIDLLEHDAGQAGGTFVVLGDFVDRGPQSRSIIDLLMAGPQWPNWKWIVLQGNHEAIMLQALRTPMSHLNWWLGNGGGATLRSYGYREGDPIVPLKVPAAHLAWLDGLPVTFEDERRIFVHAGVPFEKQVSETDRDILQWMLYSDGEDLPDTGGHVSGKHIVHGHHQSASHPLITPHRTNLDSFAWFTGRLAIGVFEDGAAQPARILTANGKPAR